MVEHLYELHRFVMNEVMDINFEFKKVLDVGCGKGFWSFLFSTDAKNGRKADYIGIEIDLSALLIAKKQNIYSNLICADIRYMPFRKYSFDVIIAVEILEHLTKEDGNNFLEMLDEVSQGRIILTTPNGLLATPNSSKYHQHLSGWTIKDLRSHGLTVRGIGFKISNQLMSKSGQLALALFYFFTPISYIFPSLGSMLIAIKQNRNQNNT